MQLCIVFQAERVAVNGFVQKTSSINGQSQIQDLCMGQSIYRSDASQRNGYIDAVSDSRPACNSDCYDCRSVKSLVEKHGDTDCNAVSLPPTDKPRSSLCSVSGVRFRRPLNASSLRLWTSRPTTTIKLQKKKCFNLTTLPPVNAVATSLLTGPEIAKSLKHPKNVVDKTVIDGAGSLPVSESQLRSSVGCYFGAVSRLARGERFQVLARRIGTDNTVQYLIQWEGGVIA